MIIHNINPVLAEIGPISIRYYGLVYVLGFLLFYFLFRYLVKQGKIKNMTLELVDTFTLYFIIGSILGARILDFVFYNPAIFINDPLEVLMVWHGGMSIHGGIIGAMIAGYIFCKKYKINFFKLADIIAVPLMFMLFLGRFANYINGELWGRVSQSTFCIDYSQSQYIANPPEGCRQPYQIYAALKNLGVGFIMFFVTKIKTFRSGFIFWTSLLLYNLGRFFIDFMRDESKILVGLTMGQILCIVFSIVSIYMIYHIYKDKFLRGANHGKKSISN